MNIKQLELQAKALAPVIREFVDVAVNKVKDELTAAHEAEIKQMTADFAEKMAQIEQKIPSQIDKTALLDEFKSLIPDFSDTGFITSEDVGLIVEQRAIELKEFIQQSIDEIPEPKNGESVTLEDVLPSIEAKITEKIAEIPVPKDGKDGKDGIDGKDALQIEILASVDMEKSYPRGTYALHNGGVMRAYQQTQGEKGWETVQNGIAGTEITQIDVRNFTISVHYTNGSTAEGKFSMPAMVYRGVYREGTDYQHGDVATFGGSLWHCDRDTHTKPGTKDSDWSLAAKKGRDGKDSGDN